MFVNGSAWFAVRATIFGVLYIILGKRVWFFPNILAEEATLGELFRFCPKKDEEERPKWTARLFYAVVAVMVILLLRHHAPDEAARARSVPFCTYDRSKSLFPLHEAKSASITFRDKKKDTKRILFQTHNNAQSIAALLNSMLFSIYDMKHSTYVVAGIKNECPTSSMMFLSGLQGLRCLG